MTIYNIQDLQLKTDTTPAESTLDTRTTVSDVTTDQAYKTTLGNLMEETRDYTSYPFYVSRVGLKNIATLTWHTVEYNTVSPLFLFNGGYSTSNFDYSPLVEDMAYYFQASVTIYNQKFNDGDGIELVILKDGSRIARVVVTHDNSTKNGVYWTVTTSAFTTVAPGEKISAQVWVGNRYEPPVPDYTSVVYNGPGTSFFGYSLVKSARVLT